ncbi:MAG: DNA/RNA non-specific endonuclease [bacterium]
MIYDATAMSESFYMSNMSPQTAGFNRGVWKRLEDKVRAYARDNDEIYVVTGPVLKDGLPTIFIPSPVGFENKASLRQEALIELPLKVKNNTIIKFISYLIS